MDNYDDIYNEIHKKFSTINDKRDNSKVGNNKKRNSKNILMDNKDLVDLTENFTDNSKSINNILGKSSKEPGYLSQFDVQTFDSNGSPSAPNDLYCSNDKSQLADLERKISYQEGWSQYNDDKMSYGVIPDAELSHNNMVPTYSSRHGYGTNDYHNEAVMNYKNELFTGRLKDTWKRKTEISPFFKPVDNLSFVYGTPVRSDDEISRYIPSRFRQNEKPFSDQKVTPGLNLGYNDVGTHGFHPTYRALEKTVDELRVKPKITYEGRIIDGMRGEKRPIQAPVISYKPDTYKENTDDDLLPKDSGVDGPKVRDNFIMKETDRANQHFEYTGGAYTSKDSVGRNVPEHMREKYKYSNKAVFTLPKPLQKFAKAELTYNQNINSYNISPTARSQTTNNNYIGTANNGSTAYAALMDNAKSTIRQTTAEVPYYPSQIMPNTMRGTAQPLDIANTTIKETIVENRLNPYVALTDNKQRVYYTDLPKTTTKESTNCEPIIPLNAMQHTNLYTNWMDLAKPTTKETTAEIPIQNMLTPINHSQRAPHPQDLQKTTMRESTVQIPYNTNVIPINHSQRAPNPQDLPRITNKETTIQIPYNTTVMPINHSQRAPNPQDTPKTTTKESTVQIPYNNNITPINHSQRATEPQDLPRTTMRESTVQTPWNTNFTPINHSQRAPHPQDLPKTTAKEQTSQMPLNNNVTPINYNQRAPHPQDLARNTIKEQTSQIPWNTVVTPVNSIQKAPHPQDIAKNTIRETTVCIPYNTVITPATEIQGKTHLQDIAKSTIREIQAEIPYNNFITGTTQQQGAVSHFNHLPLRATGKEQLIQIPYNTNTTGQIRPTPQYQDAAKPTTKETTVKIPYNTNIAKSIPNHAAYYQDTAKPTTKQSTIQIPYNTNVTSIQQQQGNATAFNREPLRETTKETTIDNNYITAPNRDNNGKGYGYMAEKMFAPNTNKQFTCQEVYIAPLEGTAKTRPYDDAYNAKVDDRKELLHWYRTPTNSNVNMGPDPEQMNVMLKETNHQSTIPAPGFTFNSSLDRMIPTGSVKIDNNIGSDRFIDPSILKQLESNEFHIPVY